MSDFLVYVVSVAFYTECLYDFWPKKRTRPWLHCSQPPQQLWTDYSKYALVALPGSGRGVSRWPAALVQGDGFESREQGPFINPVLCLLWHRPQASFAGAAAWWEQALGAGAWAEAGWGWACSWGLVGVGAWAGSIGWGWEQGLSLGLGLGQGHGLRLHDWG